MSSQTDKWALAISILAVVLTLGFNLFMWSSYYQPALQLLQQQAEKRPVLIISVYPSSEYNMTVGSTISIINRTYTFRPGESTIFHIFLSNIGTSPTVAEFLLIGYTHSHGGGGYSFRLNAAILRAGDSHEWIEPFQVPIEKTKSDLVVQVGFVTTDGVITKTILYEITPA